MEEKLRSISKRIHWSLVLRAAIFAAVWLWLPFWLFFLIALYLYFVPLFQAGKLAIPFLALLLLCSLQGSTLLFAFAFGLVFYGILVIKDLLVIDRKAIYEIVTMAVSIFLFRDLYLSFQGGIDTAAIIYSFFAAAVFGLLIHSFMNFEESEPQDAGGLSKKGNMRVTAWLSFLLMWQVLLAVFFLPLDFLYQASAAFLVAVLLLELLPEHITGTLSESKLLVTSGVVCGLFLIIIGSARWGL